METKTTVEAQSNDLLEQCRSHFPGLPWESSGSGSCIAKVPSLIFDQALVVYDNGEGDFEVSIQTNLEGMRLSKRLWVGADAIAQAAERWREFAAESIGILAINTGLGQSRFSSNKPKVSERSRRALQEAMQDV